MTEIFKILDRLLETLLLVTLASMVIVVASNVFCRFILRYSLSWGDETAQILLVWMTFLGAAVVTRDRGHFAFDYLVGNLPERAKRLAVIFNNMVVLAATAGLLYWSSIVTWQIRHWIMPATEISRAWVYVACPLGCIFILAYAARNFIYDLQGRHIEPVEEEHIP